MRFLDVLERLGFLGFFSSPDIDIIFILVRHVYEYIHEKSFFYSKLSGKRR